MKINRAWTLFLTIALALLASSVHAEGNCGNLGSVTFNIQSIPTAPPAGGITIFAGGTQFLAVNPNGGYICLPAGSFEITTSLAPELNGYPSTMPGADSVYPLGTATCQGTETVTCGQSFSGLFYSATGHISGTLRNNDLPVGGAQVTAAQQDGGGVYNTGTDGSGAFSFAPQGVAVRKDWLGPGGSEYAVYWNTCATKVLVKGGGDLSIAPLKCLLQVPPRCPDCPSPNVGAPINVLTGNVWFDQSDTRIPGVIGLGLTRAYNSDNALRNYGGGFGRGWHHTYDLELMSPQAGALVLRRGDGQPLYFSDPDSDQTFEAAEPVDEPSHIVQAAGGYTRYFDVGGREEYSSAGKLTAIVDPSGNTTVLTRDGSGRLTAVTDPGGRSLELSYDAASHVDRLAGPAGVIALYEYDASGYLSSVTYPDGSGYSFSYTAGGLLTEMRDHTGRVVERHAYDGQGRGLTSELEDGIEKYTVTYNAWHSIVEDALGNETTYEYNTFAGVPRVTRRSGPCSSCGGGGQSVEEWTYDDDGRVLTHTDANGHTESYTHDGDGNVLTHTNVLSQVTTNTYDAQGRRLTQTGPDGSLTTYTHGPAGPLTVIEKVTASVNRTTTIAYTTPGKPQTITDPRGKVTTLAYTAAGDLQSVTDPLTHATTFGHDAMGRRTTVTDALNHTTTTAYDLAGRVSRITSHDGTYTQFEYDLAGRRTSVTDPMGRTTRYIYDTYRRLERVVDPLNQVTQYGYDLMSSLTSLTDAKGQTTSFEYDSYGRVKKVIYPGGAFEGFAYDVAGRLATKTDRKNVVTTYAYDVLGRLTGKTYSNGDPAVSYTYDAGGRLLTASNGTDSLSWSYDLAGQLLSEQSTKNASTVAYSYDPGGNRLNVSLDGTLFVSYAYDDASRLTSITRGSNVFSFGYDNANRRTSMTYPNGVNTSYSYDNLNRLTRLKADKGATPITDFQYVYDAAGNRTRKQQLDYTEDYEYDPLYRLTGVQRSAGLSGLWQYGYDPVGNRTYEQKDSNVTGYSYNEKKQLLSTTGGGPVRWRGTLSEPGQASLTSALVNGQPARMYAGNAFEADLQMQPGTNMVTVQATDVNGNQTTKQYQVTVGGTGATYTYDPNGNLETKTEGSDVWAYEWTAENQLKRVLKNAVEQARFAYDPLGRRAEKVAGGTTTAFSYAGLDILREAAGATATTYVHGPAVDEPLAREVAGVLAGLQVDGLGSLVKTTDGSGAVADSTRYAAFGALELNALGRFGFTAREPDPETGLAYYRARYYDSKIGRFVSEDPVGLAAGANVYAFAEANPSNQTDPLGLESGNLNQKVPGPGDTPMFPFPQGPPSDIDFDYKTIGCQAWVISVAATSTMYGDAFVSFGLGPSGVACWCTGGFMNKLSIPTQQVLNNHLQGPGLSGGWFNILGASQSVNAGGSSTSVGAGFGARFSGLPSSSWTWPIDTGGPQHPLFGPPPQNCESCPGRYNR